MDFVTEPAKFELIRRLASRVFGARFRGLPHRTFVAAFNRFKFLDFDKTLMQSFWPALDWFAREAEDTQMALLLHEPDPVSYYHAHFGRYGALSWSRHSTQEDYYEALHAVPDNSPADALFHVATSVSWFGNSCAWGVWGDRNLGIAVAGVKSAQATWPLVDGIEWMELGGDVSDLISLNFKGQNMPPGMWSELKAAYGCKGS